MSDPTAPPASSGIFPDGVATQHVRGTSYTTPRALPSVLNPDLAMPDAPSDTSEPSASDLNLNTSASFPAETTAPTISSDAPSISTTLASSRSPTPTLRVINPSPSPEPETTPPTPLAALFPQLLGNADISKASLDLLAETSWLIDAALQTSSPPPATSTASPPPLVSRGTIASDTPGKQEAEKKDRHGLHSHGHGHGHRRTKSEAIPQVEKIVLLLPAGEGRAAVPAHLQTLLIDRSAPNAVQKLVLPPLHEQILATSKVGQTQESLVDSSGPPPLPAAQTNIYATLPWPRPASISLLLARGLRSSVHSYASLLSLISRTLSAGGVLEIQDLDWSSLRLKESVGSKGKAGGATARFVHFCREADEETGVNEGGGKELPACLLVAGISEVASERIPVPLDSSPKGVLARQALETELERGKAAILGLLGEEEAEGLVREVRAEVESGKCMVDAVVVRGRRGKGREAAREKGGILEMLFGRK